MKPIELLKGGETGEREPKTKWLLAVLGLVTTGAGYYLSITARDPMNALELLVAFVQAYVFTMLSAVFIGLAHKEHHG